YHTHLHKYLITNPDEAENLGFIRMKDGSVKIPSNKTFWYFEAKRLGKVGLDEIFDRFVKEVGDQLKQYGLDFGKYTAADSTPLEDPHGKYHEHYKKPMYKLHNLIDAEHYLPLSYAVSDSDDFDSWYLAPMLMKGKNAGAEYDTIYADNHYGTFEDYADVHCIFDMKPYFKLSKNDTYHSEITKEKLDQWYNKLKKETYYVKDASETYKLQMLMMHGKKKEVGMYFRNSQINEYEEAPDTYKEEYHTRNIVESFNNHLKDGVRLEDNLLHRGIESSRRHAVICLISILSVALTRAQHGRVKEMTSFVGLV
ncbi:unnamed protein product, partial [marine sediment metagenome]